MNSRPPPFQQPGPLSFRRYGCVITLAILVALIIVGVLALRHAVVGTALPFRAFAAVLEKGDANLSVEGISGNLATGPRVASITWGADPAHRSEILDLRVKYNGLADARKNNRVIIEDVGVRKAHIDVTDLAPYVKTSRTVSGATHPAPPQPAREGPFSALETFEIRRVLIEDVLVTNRRTNFQLSIPKVEWTGFKITAQGVETGELHVESDRLTLHTGPGRTHPLAGESVTFEKSLTGTAQPLLHPAIRQPLSFTVDFTFVPEVRAPAFHLSVLEDKLVIATSADGGQTLRVRQLDLPALLAAKELYGPEAADFPSDLTLDAAAAPADGPLKIIGGSFRLGASTFEIVAAEFAAADWESATLQAVHRSDGREIRWILPLAEVPMRFRPRFRATPDLGPREILARVFTGKEYADLSPEEKRAIDARQPAYFPAPTP